MKGVADASVRGRASDAAGPRVPVDAIVLAGGRSRRLGGEDKLVLPGPGGTPLHVVLSAVSGAVGPRGTVVVVGWARDLDDPAWTGRLVWTREEPAFAGPFAAVMTALAHVSTEAVVVCAGDLPGLTADGVARLVDARAATGADAAVYVDATGRQQPLCAVYRTAWLEQRSHAVSPHADRPARAMLDGATVIDVADAAGVTADVDTPEDLARWRGSPQ